MRDLEKRISEFEEALLHINRFKARELFEQCYQENKSFQDLESLTVRTLERIGNGWENGNLSLSQIYMSGVLCEELIDHYLPYMAVNQKTSPKIAIATLLDHHGLGKRIVTAILRSAGYDLLDFGLGLGIEELAQKTEENQIEILLISTLMLPSALKVKTVKECLTAKGLKTKIIVGGAPFRLDNDLWKAVQVDADGKNASDIVSIIERIASNA